MIAGRRYRIRMQALVLAYVAAGVFSALVTGPVFAQQDTPPLPEWMQLCGPDFVSLVGRRWPSFQQC